MGQENFIVKRIRYLSFVWESLSSNTWEIETTAGGGCKFVRLFFGDLLPQGISYVPAIMGPILKMRGRVITS